MACTSSVAKKIEENVKMTARVLLDFRGGDGFLDRWICEWHDGKRFGKSRE